MATGKCFDCGLDFEKINNSSKRCAPCKLNRKREKNRISAEKYNERRPKCSCGATLSAYATMCKDCRNKQNQQRAIESKSPYYKPVERPDDEILALAAMAAQRVLNRLGIASKAFIESAAKSVTATSTRYKIVNGEYIKKPIKPVNIIDGKMVHSR